MYQLPPKRGGGRGVHPADQNSAALQRDRHRVTLLSMILAPNCREFSPLGPARETSKDPPSRRPTGGYFAPYCSIGVISGLIH
jgi:hypothetical protein